jgi:hypothetical protein
LNYTRYQTVRQYLVAAGLAAALALGVACNPFGLPATRALEDGAQATLDAGSFELTGSYTVSGTPWTIDMQFTKPDVDHTVAGSNGTRVEVIRIGDAGYFRGKEFLAAHLAGNPLATSLIQAAGNSWWKGPAAMLPKLSDFTSGSTFRSTFLGTAVTTRTDEQTVDGVGAVELSGTRADVFIASSPPYQVLRIRLRKGVIVDGLEAADLRYGNVNRRFGTAAPTDVIDFSNFSSLTPIYTVISVDGSRCASPCVASATLKNLGGNAAANAPSRVTFVMTDPATGRAIGSCTAIVQPDIGYNATTTVSCTIDGQPTNGAVITATPTNPGRNP